MCTGPHTFQHLYGLDSGENVRDQAAVHHLGMSRSLTLISQIMQSSLQRELEILLGALEVLNEDSEPLGLRVSWDKTKPSCLYLFVVRMLRSQRDSLTLAVIFMSLLAVSQRSLDVWVRPGGSWIHWIMGCCAAGACAGGGKSAS